MKYQRSTTLRDWKIWVCAKNSFLLTNYSIVCCKKSKEPRLLLFAFKLIFFIFVLFQERSLGNLSKTQPGDCIVCFNKNDIYSVSRELEKLGKEVAVIYGSLPPNTKLAMATKFNDPDDSCKILVATDAIGMGLNLNIRWGKTVSSRNKIVIVFALFTTVQLLTTR